MKSENCVKFKTKTKDEIKEEERNTIMKINIYLKISRNHKEEIKEYMEKSERNTEHKRIL